eukprot:161094-Pyramimonas_sp.AAC.2
MARLLELSSSMTADLSTPHLRPSCAASVASPRISPPSDFPPLPHHMRPPQEKNAKAREAAPAAEVAPRTPTPKAPPVESPPA